MAARIEKVVVVGGGVIGLSTAYYLTRSGVEVVLLERGEIGDGASSGNAGAVAPGHSPMARPGRIRQAIRWMGDPTAPLYLPPRWNPRLFRWLWRFNKHCTHENVLKSMEILGPLGHQGRRLFDELMDEEGLDCHFRPDGYYEIYQTENGLSSAQEEVPLQKSPGYDTQTLGGSALRDLEPRLKPETVGGLFFPEAATLDPGRFLKGLAAAAVARGMEIRTHAKVVEVIAGKGKVRGVLLEGGETVLGSAVVLATGAYSLGLARPGGLDLPIEPAKGYHRDIPVTPEEAPPLRITAMLGERYVFCTPMGGFLRLAGTLELSGLNHHIVHRRLQNLHESAEQYFDGLETGPSRSDWVGLRPVTPDGLPVVGPAPGLEGLFVANGHAMLGLTLGPITGKLLAAWIVEGAPPKLVSAAGEPAGDLSALRPDRF